jgi:hypothetical protein
MKTKTQKTNRKSQKTGLLNRPEQSSTENPAGNLKINERTSLDATHRANRGLHKEFVLNFMKMQLPEQYAKTEIVGRWLWLDFPYDFKNRVIVNALWKLGFHFNQRRYIWQHPCGAFAPHQPHPGDPRKKYGSHFPSDIQPA